ncbi:MAG: 30S ribosomal protein S17 [Candidatus Peribacteraceae bacterium]|jgi:small subunit ribosomal protein S17|nr:30S ribosomal protein S17 [Candidatus Peribacteraceae bacterium]
MRTKKGQITSAKMTGTVTVTVDRSVFHPLYQKRFKRSKKFLADPGEHKDLVVGDTVVITECRPLSKNKCFRITEVLERVPRVSELKEEEAVEKSIHREKKRPSSVSSDSSVSSK